MRSVGELAELAGDDERGLLADVDGVIEIGADGSTAAPRGHTFIQTRYRVGYKLEALPREAKTFSD